MRACIYTAIFGGHDDLKPQPAQTVATDFLCFTDRVAITPCPPWRIVPSTILQGVHSRLRAKFFKAMSHRVFPGGRPSLRHTRELSARRYDYVIWVDGSVRLKTDTFTARVIAAIGQSGWAMFAHPDRDCIYAEADESEPIAKYAGLPIRAQVEHYSSEGFPAKAGLMACGVIARDAQDRRLAAANAMWWEENLRWTYQDQLSLPVVLWRLGMKHDIIPGHLWCNDLFDVESHRTDR